MSKVDFPAPASPVISRKGKDCQRPRICSAKSEAKKNVSPTTPWAPKQVQSSGSQRSSYCFASRSGRMTTDFCRDFKRSLPNSKKSSAFTWLITPLRTATSPYR
ncbi:hypothetical protein FQZ97_1014430 [compost metagenome]